MDQADPTKSFADQILREDLASFLRQQEEDPGNHLAPYQAGLIFSRLGEYEQAVHSYQRAIERFPDFQQAYYNMGSAFSALGRLGEAEQAYHKAISLNEQDSEAWANLGAVQEVQGRLDEAVASFSKAVELEPEEYEAQLRIARIHLSRGAYDEAKRICEAVLERHPESPEAWNDLGLVHFHQDQRAGAEGCYRKAIEFRQDYAQAWCNLGNVLVAKGEGTEAEDAYRIALQYDDRDPDLWFNLGEFYLQRGHHEAERCLWQAVELNRGDLEAWELLRRWYQGHRNPQRQHAVLRVLALARPDDAELLLELARAAEMERDFPEAIEAYRKLVAAHPADEAGQLGLVRVFLKEGQVLEAYRHLGEVHSGAPEVVDQWIHIGHRLRHRGRREEAEACFRTALEQRPDEPELAHYLGEIAMERSEWQPAFDWFERAGELNRNDRHVWIPLMRQFYAQEDHARAAACLDHLDELAQYLPGLWIEYDEVYARAGRRDELLARLERWLELGLVGGAHWAELAELYERSGQPERAAQCRARASERPPPAASAEREGAYLEPRQPAPELPVEEDAPQAAAPQAAPPQAPPVATLDAEVMEAPADAEYWIEQSESHFREGRLDDAVASLNRAVSLDLPRFRAWFRIGGLFYVLRQRDEAEAAFRKATELNPHEAKGWYNLGVCQAEQDRPGPARESFRRALELDPHFAKAWDWLGLLHFGADEHDEALDCFQRCLAITRDAPNAWHNLGMLHRAMGNAAESQRCLAESRRLGGVQEKPGIAVVRPKPGELPGAPTGGPPTG